MILILELIVLLIELYFIASNDYFDLCYGAFYALFLIAVFIAAVIFIIWMAVNRDNPEFKKHLTTALILAIVGNLLILGWVIVYVCGVYDNTNDQVVVQK